MSCSPGWVCSLMAVWLAMVPEGKNRAASIPKYSATLASRALTVGSALKTSSPTLADIMACSMAGAGRVTVSLIRFTSISKGFVHAVHANGRSVRDVGGRQWFEFPGLLQKGIDPPYHLHGHGVLAAAQELGF